MEKIWLKHYPAGVPDTIDPDHYTSLLEILEESIERYGDKTAFVNMDCEMSFAELGEKAAICCLFAEYWATKRGCSCDYDAKSFAVSGCAVRGISGGYDRR